MPALSGLLVMSGSYTLPSLSAEEWQVTLRFLLTSATENPDVGSFPTDIAPVPSNISDSGSNWTAQSNFFIEMGVADFNPVDFLRDQAMPAAEDWIGQNAISSAARLESLKWYPVGPGGVIVPAPPYAQGTPAILTYTSGFPQGGGSGSVLPLSDAVVVSHRTLQPGRSGRGRMFLPAITNGSSVIKNDGTLADGAPAAIVAAQKTFLEAVAKHDSQPRWWPVITGGDFTKYAIIKEVRCGNIVDNQRRRRNALNETYAVDSIDT